LDELSFRDIVQELLQAATEPEELKEVYIKKCQLHILKGGAIPKPWPLYFGRVVTPKSLYQMKKVKICFSLSMRCQPT